MLMITSSPAPDSPSSVTSVWRLTSSRETLIAVCAQRGTNPAKLPKLVRGELDWIVMKSLEKDRTRRFETANGLARDLQRYLSDEPRQLPGYLRRHCGQHRTGRGASQGHAENCRPC
jgi:hypothetical protein